MAKTLTQLFDEFMFECEFVKKLRPDTIRAHKKIFALFIKLMPTASIDTLTPVLIGQFFKTLHERKRVVGKGVIKVGVKKSTVATYWAKLNCFFAWLQQNGHIVTNPFQRLTHPSPSYEDKKFLKKEEVERIVTAIHTHHNDNVLILKRNLVLFYLLLFCGLRREELLSLQIRDIDFTRKEVTVRAETSKSGRIRKIPLHSTALMHIKDYLVTRKRFMTPYLIVSSKQDDQLTKEGLKHLVEKLKEHSGVPFHLHQLRHTFAVNFLKESNNIAKLKQLLGHRSISMTLTYLRCLPTSELRGDVESLNIDKFI